MSSAVDGVSYIVEETKSRKEEVIRSFVLHSAFVYTNDLACQKQFCGLLPPGCFFSCLSPGSMSFLFRVQKHPEAIAKCRSTGGGARPCQGVQLKWWIWTLKTDFGLRLPFFRLREHFFFPLHSANKSSLVNLALTAHFVSSPGPQFWLFTANTLFTPGFLNISNHVRDASSLTGEGGKKKKPKG